MADHRPIRFTALVGDAEQPVEVTPLEGTRWRVVVEDREHVVDACATGAGTLSLLIGHASVEVSVTGQGEHYAVLVDGRLHRFRLLDERRMRRRAAAGAETGERELRAAMPGKVVAVLVEAGATVERGQGLLVIEAMKMENEIAAPRAGTVVEMRVTPGQAVEAGEILACIE